jgi:hypothetical protein
MHCLLYKMRGNLHEVQVLTVVAHVRQLVLHNSQLPVVTSPTVLPRGQALVHVLFQKKKVSRQVRQKLKLWQVLHGVWQPTQVGGVLVVSGYIICSHCETQICSVRDLMWRNLKADDCLQVVQKVGDFSHVKQFKSQSSHKRVAGFSNLASGHLL